MYPYCQNMLGKISLDLFQPCTWILRGIIGKFAGKKLAKRIAGSLEQKKARPPGRWQLRDFLEFSSRKLGKITQLTNIFSPYSGGGEADAGRQGVNSWGTYFSNGLVQPTSSQGTVELWWDFPATDGMWVRWFQKSPQNLGLERDHRKDVEISLQWSRVAFLIR